MTLRARIHRLERTLRPEQRLHIIELPARLAGDEDQRPHDGAVATAASNQRWTADVCEALRLACAGSAALPCAISCTSRAPSRESTLRREETVRVNRPVHEGAGQGSRFSSHVGEATLRRESAGSRSLSGWTVREGTCDRLNLPPPQVDNPLSLRHEVREQAPGFVSILAVEPGQGEAFLIISLFEISLVPRIEAGFRHRSTQQDYYPPQSARKALIASVNGSAGTPEDVLALCCPILSALRHDVCAKNLNAVLCQSGDMPSLMISNLGKARRIHV
jgi:hypothetical protein